MAPLDNLLQLFAQKNMRMAVAGQAAGSPEAARPRAPAPSVLGILGPQMDERKQAAQAFGQGLLEATPGTEGLGKALGGARDAIAGVQMAKAQAQIERQQMALKAALDAKRDAVLNQYVGKDDLASIQGLSHSLANLGDPQSLEMVKQLEPLRQSLKVDHDKASVEGDSAYKTALQELFVSKGGNPGDAESFHKMGMTPAEGLSVSQRADEIRRQSTPSTVLPTPEKTLGPAITQALVDERQGAMGALQTIRTTEDAKRLLTTGGGIWTGKFAPSIQAVSQVLDGLGLLDNAGTNKLSATQEYLANVSQIVLAQVAAKGSGGFRGLTDDERRWLLAAQGGDIKYTAKALLTIASKINEQSRTQVQNYMDHASRSTAKLGDEQKDFFSLPEDAVSILRPKSKVKDIMEGR